MGGANRARIFVCLAVALVLHTQIVQGQANVAKLVFGGPATRQRGFILVDHRVQDFQSLVLAEVGVLTAAEHLEAVAAVTKVACARFGRGHLHDTFGPAKTLLDWAGY